MPHDVHTVRRNNTSHQRNATESIFLLHHRLEGAGTLQYSHFPRKTKQQEKRKRKHGTQNSKTPAYSLKKKLTLRELSYSSVLGKHERIDKKVTSYDIVLIHFNVCVTYFEIKRKN